MTQFFSEYSLSAYYVLGTMQSTGDIASNEMGGNPCLLDLCVLGREG